MWIIISSPGNAGGAKSINSRNMICLRCGHCCKNYFVAIVDDPSKGIVETNIVSHMGDGTPCKHLIGDTPGKYSCAIHEYQWYGETPCSDHGQIERTNSNCRIGEYILNKMKS